MLDNIGINSNINFNIFWIMKIVKNLEDLIFSYENAKNISEYAKGRLSDFKLILEMIKQPSN